MFGKGKIDIQIGKFNFSPGETIEGNVILKLDKPIKAKAVSIELIGTRKSSSVNLSRGKVGKASKSSTVFDFKQPLDREKEYPASETSYKFQIKIPENVLTEPQFGENVAGTLIKSAQILSGTSSRIDWYLIARLDIPWKFDVSKKLQINVA